jgi:hypothetical protein
VTRIRRTAVIVVLLSAATLSAAPDTSIRCSAYPGASFEKQTVAGWHFAPMTAAAFRAAFQGTKPNAYGRYTVFIAKLDHQSDTESDSSTLMVGLSVDDQKFFRLVDDDEGEWPVFLNEVEDEESLREVPEIVLLAADDGEPLFRLTVETAWRLSKSSSKTTSTYVIAIEPEPQIVTRVDCEQSASMGRCGAPTSGDELACDWSPSLRDYECTSTESYADWLALPHPAARRLTLIGAKTLPVTKPGMPWFASIQELGRRLRSDRALIQERARADPRHSSEIETDDLMFGERVLVQDVGILEPLDNLHGTVRLFATPGRGDEMELRVFAFPDEGAPFVVPFHRLVDGHEVAGEARSEPEEARTAIGENWSIGAGESFELGSAEVASLTLFDGKARGVFWLAEDETKPEVMSILRIASDVASHDEGFTFLMPAAASSFAIVHDHADVMIEPHSHRSESGELTKTQGEEDPPLPCHVKGKVTWDPAKGFYLMLTDVPCEADEAQVGVVIDVHGHLSRAPLLIEKDR